MTERLIERGFPIVQLNPLSVRERNAFKPIYKMHKWFARRSPSIFRAMVLAAALPFEDDQGNPIDLMAEFYKGHGNDPRLRRADGSPLRVLDPFMGGGTTVVEALRLGLDATGIDYNPIAWFIVKGETARVNLDALDKAYNRVAGKVKNELVELYKTRCPLTGKDADIIYAFWVKQGVCIDPACSHKTDLFRDYVIGRIQGDLGLWHYPNVECSQCGTLFDWELERCTITAGGPQVLGTRAAGKERPESIPFAFGLVEEGVHCPSCGNHTSATDLPVSAKRQKKKILVQVILDPSTGDLFEIRGEIPEVVTAPQSQYTFNPSQGPCEGGAFRCARCGRKQDVVESAKALGRPLPFYCYGFYAQTPHATGPQSRRAREVGLPTNNNKWFSRMQREDSARITAAESELVRTAQTLPLPTQEIYDGYNTNRLIIHQYRRWIDLYGPRQLLALGKLLRAIGEEEDSTVRDMLLGAFQSTVNFQSNLCRYNLLGNKIEGVTSAHDYRNPSTVAEVTVWGCGDVGQGSFTNCYQKIVEGIEYRFQPDLTKEPSGFVDIDDAKPDSWCSHIRQGSSTDLGGASSEFDLIITDPPYAGSVQYAEMADWSYVWLHQILKNHYPQEFGPELTLKSMEIIEDERSKDAQFFFDNLTKAWRECHRVLVDDGLLAFTFHHKEGDRWTGLLRSLFDAGFYLVAAYPTHSEALNSIVIQATKGITYDIIHVCRKRVGEPEPIAWSQLRREVTRTAREQLREIEQGKNVLPGPDVQMILLGKALMLFSKHYGKVLDADGEPMDLDEAMERILVLVREVRGEELPLPGALQDLDSLTHIALLHVVGKGPWARDDLHKELRGYTHGPAALLEAGLIREVKGQRARLEAVSALERGSKVNATRREAPMIDKLHALLATVNEGRSIEKLMKEWRGKWDLIVEALTWLAKVDASVKELANLTIRQIGTLGPDKGPQAITEQLDMFAAK